MSIADSLSTIYDGLNAALSESNAAITEKGGKAAEALSGIAEAVRGIETFPSGGVTPEMTTFINCGNGRKVLDAGIEVPLAAANSERLDAVEAAVMPEAAPEYVRKAAEMMAEQVRSRQTGKTFTFAFLTDMHWGADTDPANMSIRHAAQALEIMTENCHLDVIVFGGDYGEAVPGGTVEDSSVGAYMAVKLFGGTAPRVPQIWLSGSHDDAPYITQWVRLSQDEVYSAIGIRNTLGGGMPDFENAHGGYGYMDFPAHRIRIVYLNTVDRAALPSADPDNPTDDGFKNAMNLSEAQVQWLIDSAFDLSMKDEPAAWGVVVCSHSRPNVSGSYTFMKNTINYSTEAAGELMAAYKTGGAGTVEVDGKAHEYRFNAGKYADGKRGTMICGVHGYSHALTESSIDTSAGKIYLIGCPEVMYGRSEVSANGRVYEKEPGTANDTAFSVVTVDADARYVYVDCYGPGYSRSFAY